MNPNKIIVRTITEQCPLAGGEGVWVARSLRKAFEEVGYDDELACLSIGVQMREQQPRELEFTLAPNPTDNMTTLIWDKKVKEALKIQITDALGKTILIEETAPNTKFHIINTETMPSGLYFVSIYREGKMLGAEKLVVIK
jgi:Secretion system C-terminal sorting domain